MAAAVTLHCGTSLLRSERCGGPVPKVARPVLSKPTSRLMPTRRELGGMRGYHVRVGVMTDQMRTPVEETPQETFQWTKQWYPLRVPAYLEPDRPHHASLLGKDVVLWKDGSGRWNCFGDMCPHRLAPLSEGRVEADGNLFCSYHAWRFNGDGDCVSIPQSKNEEVEKRLCESSRSCAEVYPCVEKQGILWVWGESGAAAQEESKQKEPLVIEELEDPAIAKRVVPVKWGIYDLPYGWDHFIENVVDPAHVGVSHHGLFGSRYEVERGQKLLFTRDLTTEGGFQSKISNGSSTDFRPPNRVRINESQSDPSGTTSLILYCTPSEPGRCIHIGAQLTVQPENNKGFSLGNAFFGLLKVVPLWLMHLLGPSFLLQDMILLHRQQVYKRKYTADMPDQRAYFTPDNTDRMVVKFRKWINHCAGGGVPWPKGMSESDLEASTRNELFDVYRMHTSMCYVCKKALKNLKMIRVVTIAAAMVAFLKGSPWLLQNSTASGSVNVLPLGLAGLLTGVTLLLNKLISMFYVQTFSHADNN